MSDGKTRFDYSSEDITVTWDRRLCIHAGECVRSEGGVFVKDRKPWVDPSVASADAVAAIVERCPTGALTYVRTDGGAAEAPVAENTVEVVAAGPLYAHGELAIEDAPADMAGVRRRAALCRCGRSRNKPFCDNSHIAAGWADGGEIGERPQEDIGAGGELTVSPRPDGPLLVTGDLTVVGADGTRWCGTKAALCRCGESRNKPFCDGTHKTVGFTSTS